jgi:hypothetical protein
MARNYEKALARARAHYHANRKRILEKKRKARLDNPKKLREIRPPPLTKKRWKYTAGSLCRAASASIVSRYNDFDEIAPSHCLTPKGSGPRQLYA